LPQAQMTARSTLAVTIRLMNDRQPVQHERLADLFKEDCSSNPAFAT
jgi:hypothetical protein